jgi:predicted Zn-dependent peptidase
LKKNFRKKVLKNGLTILYEKRDLPIVSVAFAVRAGGINETPEEKGISHFIEHMLYKGTPTRNWKKIAEEIEKNGGKLNGFTSEEVTAYFCKMPSEKLEIALGVLTDMVKNPLFDGKELEKERQVIFEEIKLHKDNPSRYVLDEIQKSLYTGAKGMNLAGNYETMKAIDRKKIVQKFKEIYVPGNIVLCIVGKADFKKITDFAEKNFSSGKGKIPEQKFSQKNEIRTEKRKGIDQASLVFAYHVPTAGDEENYSAQVLSALMSEGMSSRLFSEIREKRNLAYAVEGDCDIGKRYAYNFVYVGTNKKNAEKVKEIIVEEFKKITEYLGKKEFEEIKNQLVGLYKIGMEDSQSQMINLLVSEIHGEAEEFYDYAEKIKKVKIEDVKKLAKKVADGNYSFFALLPE